MIGSIRLNALRTTLLALGQVQTKASAKFPKRDLRRVGLSSTSVNDLDTDASPHGVEDSSSCELSVWQLCCSSMTHIGAFVDTLIPRSRCCTRCGVSPFFSGGGPDQSGDSSGRKMNAQGQQKCAYSACECTVRATETYCSVPCSQAHRVKETEIHCDCKHDPCALD